MKKMKKICSIEYERNTTSRVFKLDPDSVRVFILVWKGRGRQSGYKRYPDGSGRSQPTQPFLSIFAVSWKTLGNMLKLVAVFAVISVALAQNYGQNTVDDRYPRNYHPPAPVHYVNIGSELAGDYKFGYDTGKGPLGQSFREETRLPDGTVKGAYGILDEQGRQRIIRYTAGKAGFVAEGDGIGPSGGPGVAPGPAPQPVAAPSYQSAPQQYSAPAQQYNPPQQQYSAPAQQYNPPQQQYNPAPQQQYRAAQPAARYNTGAWDPRKDDPYYQDGPAFIDVDRLSYNIGTAKQG